MQTIWIDAKTWQERWEVLEKIPGGGQGETFKVFSKKDQQVGFLKVIKSKKDPERRARFFREASAYDTYQIDNIPKLIESNTHQHGDEKYVLYIVTEFIEGSTLTKWMEEKQNVSLEEAIELTIKLCEILSHCDKKGIVHRDVKPDNIILLNDDYTKPQLLDFGLNFHKLEEIDFHTPDWQEVGNRFLRLPELSAGSLSKQDPRSDVSFVVGILFYLLTGEHPDLLINEQGQLPHQRPNNHDLLKKSAADKYQRLASVFDTGFAYNIEERFSNASCLISRLETLTVPIPAVLTEDEQYTAIAEIFDTPQRRRLSKAKAVIELGLRKVQETISIFDAKIKNPYARSQTQFINTGEKGSNTLFWTNELNEKIISITYEMQLSGNEITLSMSNDDVYRVMLDNPEWDVGFSEAVTNWIRNTIHQALTNPEKYLPELKLFKDVNPFTSLQLAAQEATLTGRNILAFIYDPNKPERSQLELNLRYFLENEKTRNLMNDAFVIAIISLDIFSGFSKALENISMETASWAIFDENLSFQERDEIYGNPKEGEKIMLMLNNKYRRKKQES